MLNPGDDRGLGLGLASSVLKCTIKHFLTRYTVKNGISNLYIRDPNFKTFPGGHAPGPP